MWILAGKGQLAALRAANREQIGVYWDLGRLIAERQQLHNWGKSVVETLAVQLQAEFVGLGGFSARNLWRMRAFYLHYSDNPLILPPVVAEISWTHNLLILEKCKNDHERLFYIRQAARNGWSKAVLTHHIENQTYQKTLLGQHNFETTLPPEQAKEAALALKDEFTFQFLGLADQHAEQELEQALLKNIRQFLIEMGGDFTFVGNQYRMEWEGREYFVDLLLYHRELRCLVGLELKIDEFKPEYAGKMNFYLSLLNRLARKPHENASIGIIICKSKQRTVVEFALEDVNKPIGVATYSLSPTLPEELARFFPDKDELVRRVESVSERLLVR